MQKISKLKQNKKSFMEVTTPMLELLLFPLSQLYSQIYRSNTNNKASQKTNTSSQIRSSEIAVVVILEDKIVVIGAVDDCVFPSKTPVFIDDSEDESGDGCEYCNRGRCS